jgi:hypothetical protein
MANAERYNERLRGGRPISTKSVLKSSPSTVLTVEPVVYFLLEKLSMWSFDCALGVSVSRGDRAEEPGEGSVFIFFFLRGVVSSIAARISLGFLKEPWAEGDEFSVDTDEFRLDFACGRSCSDSFSVNFRADLFGGSSGGRLDAEIEAKEFRFGFFALGTGSDPGSVSFRRDTPFGTSSPDKIIESVDCIAWRGLLFFVLPFFERLVNSLVEARGVRSVSLAEVDIN